MLLVATNHVCVSLGDECQHACQHSSHPLADAPAADEQPARSSKRLGARELRPSPPGHSLQSSAASGWWRWLWGGPDGATTAQFPPLPHCGSSGRQALDINMSCARPQIPGWEGALSFEPSGGSAPANPWENEVVNRSVHKPFDRTRLRKARLAASRFGVDVNFSRPVCQAFIADRHHTFWHMWGSVGFVRTTRRNCLPARARLPAWRAAMARGDVCARNWNQGSPGCEHAEQLPLYPDTAAAGHKHAAQQPVRALLGFDLHNREYCNRQLNPEMPTHCHIRASVACQRAGLAILWLMGSLPPYTVCHNLEWTCCALLNALPGQTRGAGIVFATPPAKLSTRMLLTDVSESRYTESQLYSGRIVFMLEVCLIATLCTNGQDIFALAKGQPFHCAFDQEALERLPLAHSLSD